MLDHERCKNCRYFVVQPEILREHFGNVCARYPTVVHVSADYGCGEFQPEVDNRGTRG